MASGTNSYSFLSDYSLVANCLFAIQELEASGGFSAHPQITERLRIFERDTLKKLYNETIRVLGSIEGTVITQEDLIGDFHSADFSRYDFFVGYLDTTNTGYSSRFQTVLNIFKEFSDRASELTETDSSSIETALITVLDNFEELQDLLTSQGLNPCSDNVLPSANFNNSTGIYIQAAGSNGTDGTPQGIHLRWSLTGDIGENHLPQGNYANNLTNPSGYNKADDYITIQRTPYTNPVRVSLDFETDIPVVNYMLKSWTYNLNAIVDGQVFNNRVRLHFKDKTSYNQITVAINPVLNPFAFLKEYSGLIEIELYYKTAYLISFDYRRNTGSSVLKFDAFTAQSEVNADGKEIPVIRRTITVNTDNPASEDVVGENIRRILLKKSANGYLKSFSFETYHDFLSSRDESEWALVGNTFALSLNDTEAFERLENAAHPIDNLWPQFNAGTRVRVANYEDKWSVSRENDPSIKNTVEQYLLLSQSDPKANAVIKTEGIPDAPELEISYLDVLNMMASDYHIARMLGLGHIDFLDNVPVTDKFVYRISYNNRKSILSPEYIDYEYLSLPTAKNNSRLPIRPAIRPILYGLGVANELSTSAFGSGGYSVLDNVRAINIGRLPFSNEQFDNTFFDNLSATDNFNVTENTSAVLYGIEYRSTGQTIYVKPEITTQNFVEGVDELIYFAHDTDYPQTGVPETVPVPDNLTSLFVHLEKSPGILL